MANQNQWAVLLCRYEDDPADPTTTTVSALAAQLRAANPTGFSPPATWDTNINTILEEYRQFFTAAGNATANMPTFFSAMTHGTVDLGATQIFPCMLPITTAQADAENTVNSVAFQNNNFHRAKAALQQQFRVDPSGFYALILSSQKPDWGSQGGKFDGGRGVYMDIRYVIDNGSKRWGHEMGHAFGLDHSRADTTDPLFNPTNCRSPPPDYRDPWDTMSAECSWGVPDPDYGAKGPGFNAWNMRSRGWLDETRIWKCPNDVFSQVLTLSPLHRDDLPGFLAAELPPMNDTAGFPKFLVELRLKARWDAGIPRSCVQIHRYDGAIQQFLGAHTYVQFARSANPDMIAGDIFVAPGQPSPQVRVLAIDEANLEATVRLSYLPRFINIAAAANQDGRIEVFAIVEDFSIRHFWQIAANRGWTDEFPLIAVGNQAQSISMIRNGAQELEIVYVGTDNHLYHNWQTAQNGNWHGETLVSASDYAIQITVGLNQDGGVLIVYRGTNGHLYTNAQKPDKSWKGEHDIGSEIRRVLTASNSDERLELLYIRSDAVLCHRRQATVNDYKDWLAEASFGQFVVDFAVAAGDDKQLEVVFVNESAELFHSFQTTPTGAWSGPQVIAQGAGVVAMSKNSLGLLELFFTDSNNVVFHLKQIAHHQWEASATQFDAAALKMVLIPNQDGHLELIYLGTDQQLYHNWQLGASNNWNGEVPY